MKYRLLYWITLCSFSLLFLFGCADVLLSNDVETDLDDAPNFVQEAYTWVNNHHQSPQLLNLDFYKNEEHSDKENTRSVLSDNISIDWSSYSTLEHNGDDIAIIPITNTDLVSFVQLTEHGRSKKNVYKTMSKLIIRRCKSDKKMSIIIGTYICDYHYYKNNYDELTSLAYSFEGTNFSGYFIASRLDGSMLSGKYVQKGKVRFSFLPNTSPLSKQNDSVDNNHIHLHINLRPSSIMFSNHSRSSINPEQEETGEYYCSACFQLADECICCIIIFCNDCRSYIEDCTCNKICEQCGLEIFYGTCGCCPICHKYYCECNMNSGGNSGNGSGSGSSSGSGGSSGSGSGSSSGNSSSNENNTPEVSYNKDGYICIGFNNDVLSKNDFSPFLKSDERGCFNRCKEMLKNAGCEVDGNDIRLTVNDPDTGCPTGLYTDFQKGINKINEALDNGKPIILNVDYKAGSSSRDGAGDHFIIVVGKAVVSGKTYYHFYDPATQHVNVGTQNTNVLYFNDYGYLYGTFITANQIKVNNYTVTSVRTNK